jgi:excinuclease ABC subunit A
MRVVSASDFVMDIGPGAGEEGGKVVAFGRPEEVAAAPASRTSPYLARYLSADPSPSAPRVGRARPND